MDREALNTVAKSQSGLFTSKQAQTCGYTRYQIRRRVTIGEWQQVLPKVYAHSGASITPWLRDRAAVLAIEGAILAGPSAARLHGFPVLDSKTYILVDPNHHIALPEVVGMRCAVTEDDVIVLDDVFITCRGRTVFDCLRILPRAAGEALLDRALQKRWTSLDEQLGYLAKYRGMFGRPTAALLIRRAHSGARSAAERLLASLLRRSGIRGWHANYPVGNAIVDVAFPQVKLAIEVDGRAWHSAEGRFERDRERQNIIVTAGWQVLRFTWLDLTARPAYVVNAIQTMLRQLQVPNSGGNV
ncbi:MAG: type IV toxin-antitoxin system AbiEi family antitoxin domain-containing protein [Longispora sp.]|nr:type IV toxin-antitoxin system AbiEi family antitoxin domain-containing protein [Longispora sp. (in: high G+C Gram-positive bacteria)]